MMMSLRTITVINLILIFPLYIFQYILGTSCLDKVLGKISNTLVKKRNSSVCQLLNMTSFTQQRVICKFTFQVHRINVCCRMRQVRPHIPHLCPTCLIQNPYDHGTMGMVLPYKVASAKSPRPSKVDECLTCWS